MNVVLVKQQLVETTLAFICNEGVTPIVHPFTIRDLRDVPLKWIVACKRRALCKHTLRVYCIL